MAIQPIRTFTETGILDEEHGLASTTNVFHKAIQNKEDAIAALAAEMDMNISDIKALRSLMSQDGTIELVEGTAEYDKLMGIMNRLKSQGHDIDISQLCSQETRNGKKVLVFNDEQKKEFKVKLDGMQSFTESTKQEQIARLQRLTGEERDLWNMMSNIIKAYYDQIKTIIQDTAA
jgi:hypothetical protein